MKVQTFGEDPENGYIKTIDNNEKFFLKNVDSVTTTKCFISTLMVGRFWKRKQVRNLNIKFNIRNLQIYIYFFMYITIYIKLFRVKLVKLSK